MKKKLEFVCWILFTICSGVCFFINFMSKPSAGDTHAFTLYLIAAAAVSMLYPVCMFILGVRNRYLYEKLKELAEEKYETVNSKTSKEFRTSVPGYTVPDMNVLVSALTAGDKLTEEEKDALLEYIKTK